jgi:hypothetical protein
MESTIGMKTLSLIKIFKPINIILSLSSFRSFTRKYGKKKGAEEVRLTPIVFHQKISNKTSLKNKKQFT